MLIPAIAIAAILLAPSLASARMGNVGVSTSVGSVGVVRADAKPPRIHSNVQMLNCHTYQRQTPNGGTQSTVVCK